MDPAAFDDQLNDLAAVAGLSGKLRNKLFQFYVKSTDPKVDTDGMEQFVNKNLDPDKYKGADREAVRVFRGIWEDSKEYWNSGSGTHREKGCPYWEYANDAIGGVFGLMFGGVGSVVLGAAASAYTHWECN
jgi:hypothetical protein